MGIRDTLKSKLAPAKEKVSNLAQQHEEKVDHGLDKAAKLVDDKTKGKYRERIHSGTGKAKDAFGRLAGRSEPTEGDTTPPTGPSADPPEGPPAA
jgi:hypothetical protein